MPTTSWRHVVSKRERCNRRWSRAWLHSAAAGRGCRCCFQGKHVHVVFGPSARRAGAACSIVRFLTCRRAGVNLDGWGVDAALPLQFADHCLAGNVCLPPLHACLHCMRAVSLLALPVSAAVWSCARARVLACVRSTSMSARNSCPLIELLVSEIDDPSAFLTRALTQIDNSWQYNKNYLMGAN